MMKTSVLPAATLAIMAATSAQPRQDCDAPIRNRRGREAVRGHAEGRGWTLRCIKIDDGCYEVYGTERGRRFESKIDPATLNVIEIEEHRNSGDALLPVPKETHP